MTTEPTDAELKAMWQLHAADIGGIFYYARAVLAKWGQPAQAAEPAQADEYPALVCDYCGALTPDPWHSSGMLHGKMSKHIHSCDACAARGAAEAQDTRGPLTDEQIHAIYDEVARRESYAGAVTRRSIVRAIEAAHGITGGQHGADT